MTLDIVRGVLAWSAVINLGLLLFWALWVKLGHDFIYKQHTRWVKMSVERFNEVNYQGMMFFRIFIFFFNIVPYLAIRIVS